MSDRRTPRKIAREWLEWGSEELMLEKKRQILVALAEGGEGDHASDYHDNDDAEIENLFVEDLFEWHKCCYSMLACNYCVNFI